MLQHITCSTSRSQTWWLLARSSSARLGLFLVCLFSSAQIYANTLVATLPGDFSVGNTGAAQYSIPIEIPEGTAGVQPQLTINYNSQSDNGLLGVGWSLAAASRVALQVQRLLNQCLAE